MVEGGPETKNITSFPDPRENIRDDEKRERELENLSYDNLYIYIFHSTNLFRNDARIGLQIGLFSRCRYTRTRGLWPTPTRVRGVRGGVILGGPPPVRGVDI